ncbi:MAG: hypothetical protein WD604_00200 [Balneolaceae bacterium]
MDTNWLNKPIEERINWYREKIRELQDYLEARRHFSREEKEISRLLLKTIKERANADHKVDSSSRKVNQLEEEFKQYYRVISRVWVYLPKLNTNPDKWHSGLYDAMIEIDFIYSE